MGYICMSNLDTYSLQFTSHNDFVSFTMVLMSFPLDKYIEGISHLWPPTVAFLKVEGKMESRIM